jgi:hypothetical protein
MTDSDMEDDGMNEISQLLNDYTSLQAAHRSLTNRCETQAAEIYAEVQQEMDSLRAQIKELEGKLSKSESQNEELQASVRDLRVRVEESRRALMRLQGPGGAANSGTNAAAAHGGSGPSSAGLTGSAGSNPNRRSMLPGSLTSWNPREASSGSTDQTYSHHTAEEAAELKKSKRASLAFGPNANTIARRAQGHRRIASGSKIGQTEEDSSSMAPAGLRELHLGSSQSPTPPIPSTSKRSSFLGSIFSPASENGQEDAADKAASGSFLMPTTKAVRRTSNSSSISGSGREELETSLGIPSNGSRSNVSSGPPSMASPIYEAGEGRLYDEPDTARLPLATSQSFSMGSHFANMQQQQHQYQEQLKLQRQLSEARLRVQNRDAKLEEMQREMQALRSDLEEAKEARMASETCLKALRDFVKDEGGRSSDPDGGAQVLKGVKLPPLPTDRDTDDLSSDSAYPTTPGSRLTSTDVNTPTQATSNSSWRSFSNTFAGLSRAKSTVSEELNNTSTDNNNNNKPLPSIATGVPSAPTPLLSPAANIGVSIGNLWNRSSASRRQDSVSVSSTGPSDSTVATSNESRHTSMTSSPSDTSVGTTAPPTAYKGFNWFTKKTSADDSVDESTASPASPRVSSPPFASLDNHVLTIDQVNNSTQPRKISMTSSNGATAAADAAAAIANREDSLEPNDRVRKTMQKAEVVDEDTGFAPPTF